MPPKHVLQQAASAHDWYFALIGFAVVILICAALAVVGYVQEKRKKQE
jgi:hypothetical protein